MKIKEEDLQHILIVSPFGERTIGVTLLVLAIIFIGPLVRCLTILTYLVPLLMVFPLILI